MGIYVPTEYSATHKQFLASETTIEVLIGGQSDIKATLAPDMIDRHAFNYADTGESPIESFFKMRFHLPCMPRLRLLIYSVSLPSFVGVRKQRLYSRLYRRGHITRADYPALRAFGVISPPWEHFSALFRRTGKPELYETRRNVIRLLKREPLVHSLKGPIVKGYRYQTGSRVDPDLAVKMAAHHFEGDPLDPVLIDYFEKLLRLCADHDVKVVALSPPVTDAYLAAAEKYVTRDELFAATIRNPRFGDLIDRHIDMTDLFATRYECFRDQNHMNAAGAREASRYVATQLGDLVHPATTELVPPTGVVG